MDLYDLSGLQVLGLWKVYGLGGWRLGELKRGGGGGGKEGEGVGASCRFRALGAWALEGGGFLNLGELRLRGFQGLSVLGFFWLCFRV